MNARTTIASRCSMLLGLGLCCAVTACDDPLTDPATVTGPRVIGARVRAEVDVGRAEPGPGERATLDWLVVSDVAQPFAATVAWCVGAPTLLGAPRCAGSLFDERRVTGSFGEAVTLEFTLPAELAPGDAWLARLGHCEGGEARFEPMDGSFRCPGGAEPLSALYRGFVPGAAPNQNPSLDDDVLLLGGVPWEANESASAPGSSCVDTNLPRLIAGVTSVVELELRGDDREPLEYPPGSYAAHARESLVYTHVSSHPGLGRAFSAINFDAEELRFTLPLAFGADVAPAPEGETVLFYLVVRDERGGVDWLLREACLLSP